MPPMQKPEHSSVERVKVLPMKKILWIAVLPLAIFTARAEEPRAPDASPAFKDFEPDEPPPKLEKTNRYKLPANADAEALVDFCLDLQYYEPESDADADRHEKRAPRAIKRACKRILDLEPDKDSPFARFAQRELLGYELNPPPEIDSPRTDATLEKFRAFFDSPSAGSEDADLADALAEYLGGHPEPKSIEWSAKIGALLAGNADLELARSGKVLQGTSRRLALIGHPLKLDGTTIDGKRFDIASMKDKTVLIFFWSTDCDFCLDEIPILKENYEGYKAKGFEVVGICADEDRKDVADFLKAEQIPWITLHEKGGRHPAMDDYGINSLPATILVGKDGNVSALDVRDEALGEKLEALLGAPAEVKDAAAKDAPPKKDAPKKDEPRKKDAPKKDEPRKKDAPAPKEEEAETPAEKLQKRYTF